MRQKSRSRGRPRAYDPEEALDKAADRFWETGFHGTSLDALGAAMGMGRPSIQNAFGDKEQLFLKALGRYRETIGLEPLRALQASDSIEAALGGFFDAVIRTTTADPRHPGCFVFSVASATDLPSARAFVQAGLDEVEGRLAERLRRARDAGELPSTYPVALGARLAANAMLAMVVRARAGASSEQLAPDGAAAATAVLQVAAEQDSHDAAGR